MCVEFFSFLGYRDREREIQLVFGSAGTVRGDIYGCIRIRTQWGLGPKLEAKTF